MGGRLSLLGLPREAFGLDWNQLLIFKGITIHGIIGVACTRPGTRWTACCARDGSICARDHPCDADGEGRRGNRAAAVRPGGQGGVVPWGQNA
jgi:hypothetical protein